MLKPMLRDRDYVLHIVNRHGGRQKIETENDFESL